MFFKCWKSHEWCVFIVKLSSMQSQFRRARQMYNHGWVTTTAKCTCKSIKNYCCFNSIFRFSRSKAYKPVDWLWAVVEMGELSILLKSICSFHFPVFLPWSQSLHGSTAAARKTLVNCQSFTPGQQHFLGTLLNSIMHLIPFGSSVYLCLCLWA